MLVVFFENISFMYTVFYNLGSLSFTWWSTNPLKLLIGDGAHKADVFNRIDWTGSNAFTTLQFSAAASVKLLAQRWARQMKAFRAWSSDKEKEGLLMICIAAGNLITPGNKIRSALIHSSRSLQAVSDNILRASCIFVSGSWISISRRGSNVIFMNLKLKTEIL